MIDILIVITPPYTITFAVIRIWYFGMRCYIKEMNIIFYKFR